MTGFGPGPSGAEPEYIPLPRDPRITERTARAAELEGYDPEVPNAPLSKRFLALGLDALIYGVLVTLLVAVALVFGANPGAETDALELAAVLLATFGAPLGFYGYRAAGDAIFEGSPGKRALGLSMTGPNGLPVSASDGLRRNLWLLPSIVPFAGWAVSGVLMIVFAIGAGSDPLGRGGHDRMVGTRVQEGASMRVAEGRRHRRELRESEKNARRREKLERRRNRANRRGRGER
ncbi:RDD family protein [Corynebacterium sp. 335C]